MPLLDEINDATNAYASFFDTDTPGQLNPAVDLAQLQPVATEMFALLEHIACFLEQREHENRLPD